MTDLVRTGYGHVIRSPEAAGEGGGCCPYVIMDTCPSWPHDYEVAEDCQIFVIITVYGDSFIGGGNDIWYRVKIDGTAEAGTSFVYPSGLQTASTVAWTYQWLSVIAGAGTAGTHSIALELSIDAGANWSGAQVS